MQEIIHYFTLLKKYAIIKGKFKKEVNKLDSLTQFFDNYYIQTILKIVLIIILSGIIGLERDSWNKPAGFRTHALVGISSVLVVLCGEYFVKTFNVGDPTRIPAQLLSGIGFIGAGTILRDGFNVKGLTTAASLLAVTCIGLCIGAGFYFIGITATVISYLVLSYSYLLTDKLDHFINSELSISFKGNKEITIKNIEAYFDSKNIAIKKIDFTNEFSDSNIETESNKNPDLTSNAENKSKGEIYNVIFHIKYEHNIKLSSIITKIGSMENISKVEEV